MELKYALDLEYIKSYKSVREKIKTDKTWTATSFLDDRKACLNVLSIITFQENAS